MIQKQIFQLIGDRLKENSMSISKQKREIIRNKYNGRCAYTGKQLGDDWQVDHMTSKCNNEYMRLNIDINNIDNLVPALKIVNHYKRDKSLEGFRVYMLNFHKRLARLPKSTRLEKTAKRIKYMHEVAEAFDITVNKPFSGEFYFETL